MNLLLSLSAAAAAASNNNIGSAFAFRVGAPSIETKHRGASRHPHQHCRRSTIRLLSSPDDEDYTDAPQQRLDPLIASLTRIDEPTPDNVPTVQAPLIGEIPADGNLALLVPAAAISVVGFIFSIVVAFNSRDAIVSEVSKVELPKMEYTPTKVDPEKCRGLCSSQEEDLDGLRNFMESLRRDN